jgi:hypothetical protein
LHFTYGLAVTAKGIAIWSAIEPGVGIIAGSLVTLRPLVRSLVATFRSRSTNYTPGQRAARPYLQDSQSTTNLREPEVPDTIILGFYKNELLKQFPDEEMAQKDTLQRSTPRKKSLPNVKGLFGGLPLAFFKSSRSRSKTLNTSDEDAAEEWRQAEITQAARAKEEREKREKEWWRPPVPPKKEGDNWKAPTPLKGELERRPATSQPFRGIADIWRPNTAPELHGRHSGLPLNFFSPNDPLPPVGERKGGEEYPRDDVKKEELARRKLITPKKKRGSGLPLNMFGSNHESDSSHSSTSSF